MSASISSRFTEDILLDDYYLVSENIKMLSGSRVKYLTPNELRDLRETLLGEVKKDYSFKLITLLEARIREDFLVSLRRRKRDPVSRSYRALCDHWYAHGRTRTMPVVLDPDDVYAAYSQFKDNVFDR